MNESYGPPDSWFDPPKMHEICKCEDCCEVGAHHKAIEFWSEDGCLICEEQLKSAVESNEFCLEHHMWWCEEEHKVETAH